MKRDSGVITASIVAAATVFGVSSIQNRPIGDTATATHAATPTNGTHDRKKPSLYKGPCEELKNHLGGFLSISVNSLAAPSSCAADGEPTPSAANLPKGTPRSKLKFVIATLPDPVHTHISLGFDRDTEAIQQAAQDSGYTYDSSWLPWDTEKTDHPLISDEDIANDRRGRQEDQPGILLFRKSLSRTLVDLPEPVGSPYNEGLVVFIIGEEATGGIHRDQFNTAVQWISALESESTATGVQILGPSFSGSLPSMEQLLRANNNILQRQPALNIFSGGVTSNISVNWFVHNIDALSSPTHSVHFLSFQQDDNQVLDRYYCYAEAIGVDMTKLAVISEDETAYGAIDPSLTLEYPASEDPTIHGVIGNLTPPPPDPVCPFGRPHHKGLASFYYPRDISALRAAYQEQSLFSRLSSQSSSDASRHTLRTDLADPEQVQHDTIRTYGKNQTALSQEAVLLQIVDMLREHQSQFILLKSSNPLDQVFLAHFFKLTYPQGRVVTLGADLLLRREVGSSGLNGILALSTYPLLAGIDDWTQLNSPDHSHRTFISDGAEGTYIALRALLGSVIIQPDRTDAFLPLICGTNPRVSDYSKPFWLKGSADQCHRPLTWLTVLGNDGFAPVASLGPVLPGATSHEVAAGKSTAFDERWPRVPLGMNLALLALWGWAVFHVICCCSPSITIRPEHRSYFVRIWKTLQRRTGAQAAAVPKHSLSHPALLVLASSLLGIAGTLLASGYGWMSAFPGPIQFKWQYTYFPVSIWLIAGFAVAANAWVEYQLNFPGKPGRTLLMTLKRSIHWKQTKGFARVTDTLNAIWVPTLCYIVLTVGFYWLFKSVIDSPLPAEARILSYFRSMHLTSGVSPIVPPILLTLGMYAWCWYSLRGIALFGADRPLLPLGGDLRIRARDGSSHDLLSMLSGGKAGEPIENLCWPFHPGACQVFVIALAVLVLGDLFIFGQIPLRSLGRSAYSVFICCWIAISISILLANLWQLSHLWLRLQALLIFLDKLPLRRTMQEMRGFSWGSIWKIGGNVFDVRYKLFYRQFETLNHLRASLIEKYPGNDPAWLSTSNLLRWIGRIESTRPGRWNFSVWYSRHWNKWTTRDLSALQGVQIDVARTAGIVLTEILVPAWTTESKSLLTSAQISSDAEESDSKDRRRSDNLETYIRNSEELVCLVYLGFIQNIVGRMRTFIMGMVFLFLSIAMVVPAYPFDPRPVLAGAVIILFVMVGAVVVTIYAQMFRDTTLSHLTNTNPGELGIEFWMKLISIAVGPVFGLLATIFPGVSDFFLSWLQPSLSAIK